MIKVTNLSTGAEQWYSCSPEEAVIAARAQEGGDFNTWDYPRRYAPLVSRGRLTVACGNWCAFLDGRDNNA